jgi:hypothetical protein
VQSRHCGRAAGRGRVSKPTSISACHSQGLSRAQACPPPTTHRPLPHPSLFPRDSTLARFGKEAGSSLRLRRLGFGRGWRKAEAFPRICGKPGSGKVLQSSQQRLPRSPPPSEQTAASTPASPPPPPLPPPAERSGRLAHSLARSREAGRAPGWQALLLGRKPQLTQAARKAEAALSGSTSAPTPGTRTGG